MTNYSFCLQMSSSQGEKEFERESSFYVLFIRSNDSHKLPVDSQFFSLFRLTPIELSSLSLSLTIELSFSLDSNKENVLLS